MSLEEILERMKNHSTKSWQSEESEESSQDSDVCPICGGDEWILARDGNGIEKAIPCSCREKAVMSRRLRFAEIPEVFKDMDLKTFQTDVYQKPDSRKKFRMPVRL